MGQKMEKDYLYLNKKNGKIKWRTLIAQHIVCHDKKGGKYLHAN